MRKKGTMLLLFALMVVITSSTKSFVTAKAAGAQGGIQPYWQNTSDVTVVLSINNEKAVLSTIVEGKKNASKVTAVAVLERRNANGTYTEIERWDNLSSNSSSLEWTATRYVTKGYTYRFTITATVYKDGIGETVSGSKSTPA